MPSGWDFVLAKWGSLDRYGDFRPRFVLTSREAWVTYRLGRGVVLPEASGRKLGERLSAEIKGTSIEAVELDIEPMPYPISFIPFFRAVRLSLNPKIELRVAVPALADKPLSGPSWTKAEVKAVSTATDGVDIMLYDTGLKEVRAYQKLFADVLWWSVEHIRTTGKRVTIGLPAYEDKTRLHDAKVENLAVIHSALQQITPGEQARFCAHPPRFAIYAEWTLDEGERHTLDSLRKWKIDRCGG